MNLTGPQIVTLILLDLVRLTKPGVKTIDLNNHAEKMIASFGVKSYNKGYCPPGAIKPFPYAVCINTGNVIAHGFPGDEILVDGELVSYDLAIIDKEGNCADAAITVGVGEISPAKKRLLYYAYKTMMAGVEQLYPGKNTEEIARNIEQYAMARGYKINRRFCGHGIGREMHEQPKIYNTTEKTHKYAVLEEGQIVCVEPMITYGADDIGVMDSNGWICRTADGKPSAFFEVMVKITKEGPEILTKHITPPEL